MSSFARVKPCNPLKKPVFVFFIVTSISTKFKNDKRKQLLDDPKGKGFSGAKYSDKINELTVLSGNNFEKEYSKEDSDLIKFYFGLSASLHRHIQPNKPTDLRLCSSPTHCLQCDSNYNPHYRNRQKT